jgi:hypothetical protein
MTEYTDIVTEPEKERKERHRKKSNPLNSRNKTTKWLRSTLKTGIKKSELSKKEVLAIAENAVKETSASGKA